MIKRNKIKTFANIGYTSGGVQSNLQAPGSQARAVTVDSESATEPARCIPSTLWARLIDGTADRHENQRQFDLTLFDSCTRLTIDQNKKWSQNPLKKRGDTEKPNE